jgi:hypothetical protein
VSRIPLFRRRMSRWTCCPNLMRDLDLTAFPLDPDAVILLNVRCHLHYA